MSTTWCFCLPDTVTSLSTANAWLAALETPLVVTETLATPVTYQLTPTAVETLLGTNNVWADTGDVIRCEYPDSVSAQIAAIWDAIHALEPTPGPESNVTRLETEIKAEEPAIEEPAIEEAPVEVKKTTRKKSTNAEENKED